MFLQGRKRAKGPPRRPRAPRRRYCPRCRPRRLRRGSLRHLLRPRPLLRPRSHPVPSFHPHPRWRFPRRPTSTRRSLRRRSPSFPTSCLPAPSLRFLRRPWLHQPPAPTWPWRPCPRGHCHCRRASLAGSTQPAQPSSTVGSSSRLERLLAGARPIDRGWRHFPSISGSSFRSRVAYAFSGDVRRSRAASATAADRLPARSWVSMRSTEASRARIPRGNDEE